MEDNDSSETRDFTIFIAKKHWVKTTIRPMLELSALDQDMMSVQYCRKLLFWLLKDLSENTYKALYFNPLNPDKEFKQREADESAPTSENIKENQKDVKALKRNAPKKDSELMEIFKARKQNAIDQYNALISFKEALCSEMAIKAIVLLFGKMWQTEISLKEEYAINGINNIPNNKLVDSTRQSYISVGVCLICVCRLLEIDAIPALSSTEQIKVVNRSHQQLIVFLRAVLLALPGIFVELYADVKSVRYFDSWLSYLFRILRNTLRGFRASELFLIWQAHGLLDVQQQESIADANASVPVPATIQMRNSKIAMREKNAERTVGILKATLKQENGLRAMALGLSGGRSSIDSRHSRFGGVFIRPIEPNLAEPVLNGIASSNDDKDEIPDDSKTNKFTTRATAFVTRGVQIANSAHALPTGKAKLSRKSIAFAKDSMHNTDKPSESMELCGQEACVIVATVADMMCESKGLNELIKRVNEDLRRDEGVFYDDMELIYFEILSKMLAYNRLKLMAQKAEFETRTGVKSALDAGQSSDTLTATGWVPDLRNMIEATSNMSENRIVRSMEDLIKKKRMHDLHKPIECFKEIICYIRIELMSANLGHRDLAVAALFRIFYTMTTDRRDPLPKLIAEWKPSTYTKEHTCCLIELLHETMKTLDLARSIFSDEAEIAKARKIRLTRKSSLDIEQYTAAAYRFDVDEYFRKLVTNGSVRMYTRLLEKYSSNDAATNYYVYSFFQRLNNFRLEQTFPTPSPAEVKSRESGHDVVPQPPVALGYLLFNVHTMAVFATLLNDASIQNDKVLVMLVSLAKAVVRRFGEVAEKNRMLFVECLFQHPNPSKHMCERIDNVYEAQAYKPGTDSFESRGNFERKKKERLASDDTMEGDDSASDDENNRAQPSDAGFVLSGSEDEFNENDPQFAAQPKNIKRLMAAQKKKELEKIRRKEERRARQQSETLNGSPSKPTHGRLQKVDRSRKWSKEEDDILKRLYKQYAGSSAIFSIISLDEGMQATGKERSAAAVEKRCRELDLHMTVGYKEDESENEDDIGGEKISTSTVQSSGVVTSHQRSSTLSANHANKNSMLVDSLDLDVYEAEAEAAAITAAPTSKKRKMKKSAMGSDSDDDDNLFEVQEDDEQKSVKVRNRGVIDSDDD